MNIKVNILLGCLALIINEAAGQCDKLPADFNVDNCCKFPDMGNAEVTKKIVDSIKSQNLADFLNECKFAEGMFTELKMIKDNGMDKEAMLKQVDAGVKEASWKPVMKAATEQCFTDVMKDKDEIIKTLEAAPFNIKKDQCNVLYMSMMTCVHLEAFSNCPKDSWTEEKKCTDAKAWIDKCGDNIDALSQIAEMKKGGK